jgi:UDP-N-acetylglucosamine--N-acetylmuramyl-(pentapeptide) pyrophosphoryl-undecaprenol N-acetylglucosamine transferase
MQRLLICAGGTGGGIYPAIAVLEALNTNEIEVLWVGSQNELDANLVHNASDVKFVEIPSAGVHGVGLRTLPGNLIKLAKGFLASRKIIHTFKPDAVFFTGGYVAVPMSFAAIGIPQIVFVPDIEPGLALQQITQRAKKIALSVSASKDYFKDQSKLIVTGYPTRKHFGNIAKREAKRAFAVSESLPTVLVFGGSRGARSINHALLSILPDLIDNAQVIHVTGELDWDLVSAYYEGMSESARQRYFPYPYLHKNMPHAMRLADLVVSRAGASIIGEYPIMGLPAILVPYPYAWKYQKQNADYLVQQGAAIMLADEDLTQKLYATILGVINNPQKMAEMKKNMEKLAHPDAAGEIAGIISEFTSKRERKS